MIESDGQHPRCLFAVRYPAGGGRWRYQRISIANPEGSAYAALKRPPPPGDLVLLWDADLHRRGLPQPEGGPAFRVVDRQWG